jgi:hypothetical protein
MSKIHLLIFILIFSFAAFAQTETLTNLQIIEMSKAGLAAEIVLKKIESSRVDFNVSTDALIALKKSGVADEIISAMLEKAEANKKYSTPTNTAISSNTAAYSDSTPAAILSEIKPAQIQPSGKILSPKEALLSAQTIAFAKSSLQPSRQALEKELFKRKDFQALNLTIERYKESADLYVEIGYVSLSWLTHRYVYRIYDRRSGAVMAAGETTSWGSLAENLARHISKSLTQIANGAQK